MYTVRYVNRETCFNGYWVLLETCPTLADPLCLSAVLL